MKRSRLLDFSRFFSKRVPPNFGKSQESKHQLSRIGSYYRSMMRRRRSNSKAVFSDTVTGSDWQKQTKLKFGSENIVA